MIKSTDISPPWIQVSGVDPWWGGWHQGTSEAWLHERWLPFWRALDVDARRAYLLRWVPPSADWAEYLEKHWI
jgi:hypothetical protein